jgi:hypothetical protein
MHLLSNHQDVEADIKQRFMASSSKLRGRIDCASTPECWRDKPRRVATLFDAYERGEELVGPLFVIWRGQVPTAMPPSEEGGIRSLRMDSAGIGVGIA